MCMYPLKLSETDCEGVWGPYDHKRDLCSRFSTVRLTGIAAGSYTSPTSACCSLQHDRFGGWSVMVQDKILRPVYMLVPWVWPPVGGVMKALMLLTDTPILRPNKHLYHYIHYSHPSPPLSPQIVLNPGLFLIQVWEDPAPSVSSHNKCHIM